MIRCACGAQDVDVLARHAHDLSSDTRLLATLRHRLANHDVETQRWRLDAALWQRECFRLSQEAARASVRPSSAPHHDRTGAVGSAVSFERLFESLARSSSEAPNCEPAASELDVIDVDSDDALDGHPSEPSERRDDEDDIHADGQDQVGVGKSLFAVHRDDSATTRGSPVLLRGTITTTPAPLCAPPNRLHMSSPASVFASPVAPPVFRSGDISATGLSALHVTADQLLLSRSIASLKRAMEATPTPVSPPATNLTTTDAEPALGSPHSIAAEFRDYFERRYGGEGKKESRADLVMSAAPDAGHAGAGAGASLKAAYSAATAQAQQVAAAAAESKVSKTTGRPKTAARYTGRDSSSSRVVPWTDVQEMGPPLQQQLQPQPQQREAEEMAADALLRDQWARDQSAAQHQEPLTLSGLRTPTASMTKFEPWRAKLGRLTTHHDVSLVSSLAHSSPSTVRDQV